MRARLLLLILLLGILLPMGWFTRYSALWNRVFAFLFGPLWMHVLMHALLFAALAFLLAGALRWRLPGCGGWGIALAVLGLVLMVALLQEGLQLAYKARHIVADDLLDLGTDLVGGALGALASALQVRRAVH